MTKRTGRMNVVFSILFFFYQLFYNNGFFISYLHSLKIDLQYY